MQTPAASGSVTPSSADICAAGGNARPSKALIAFVALVLAAPPLSAPAGGLATNLEQDRAAILAMAGDFEVTFRFEETVALAPDYELREPYLEHATETVRIVADEERRIVLQHILQDQDSGRVVKHWKQEWVYEDGEVHRFEGDSTWIAESRTPAGVAGTWSQRVSQVDDTPRYEGIGRWTHEGGVSSWTSEPTRRPLPRREHTKRDDYEVLLGTNRHTITPDGWVHEQDNVKQVSPDGPILCRELGINTYRRTTTADFANAVDYWNKTAAFWSHVSARFDQIFAEDGRLQIGDPPGQPLTGRLAFLAKQSAEGELQPGEPTENAVDAVLESFLVRPDKPGE